MIVYGYTVVNWGRAVWDLEYLTKSLWRVGLFTVCLHYHYNITPFHTNGDICCLDSCSHLLGFML